MIKSIYNDRETTAKKRAKQMVLDAMDKLQFWQDDNSDGMTQEEISNLQLELDGQIIRVRRLLTPKEVDGA